ncbi:MAG: hypothetical protein ACLPKT_01250 [Methylocella sp.]
MPKRLAFLSVVVLLWSTSAFAQNVNDLLNLFGGAIQQGYGQAVQSEWRRLPPAELSCLDKALGQRGASVNTLASRGVTPSDPWVAQLRSSCQSQIVQSPQPAITQSPPYVVDGLALGGEVRFESDAYKQYQCGPSEKFPGFTWCHKQETKRENRIEITFSNSILHTQDGTALYINRYIEPAFFAPNEVQNEIDRLSATFGEQARTFPMPQREGLPNAVIAIWGKIQLEQLGASDVSTVASGGSVNGLLVSFLGDLQRSAKAGAPVYRLAGGAGFLWAATFNQAGRGVLRFLTMDASKITSPIVAGTNPPPQLSPSIIQSPNVEQPPMIPRQQAPMTAATPNVEEPKLPSTTPPRQQAQSGQDNPDVPCHDLKECTEVFSLFGKIFLSMITNGNRNLQGTLDDWRKLKTLYENARSNIAPELKSSLVNTLGFSDDMFKRLNQRIPSWEQELKNQNASKPRDQDQNDKLAGFYIYYLVLQDCEKRFPGVFKDSISGLREFLKESEKGLPKETTDALWNSVAEKFKQAEVMFTTEGDEQAMGECRYTASAMVLLIPHPAGTSPTLPKKDF